MSCKTARFWVYKPYQGERMFTYNEQDTFVKLSLKDKQTVRFSESWFNGEGWSYTSDEYTRDGNTVEWIHVNGGSDCDGKHEYTTTRVCSIKHLKAERLSETVDVLTPSWQNDKTRVYDQYAQMAGY